MGRDGVGVMMWNSSPHLVAEGFGGRSAGATALPASPLPRLQLFEWHELTWFPESFRNAITEVLRVLGLCLRLHEVIAPVLAQLLVETGTDRIVDLCSGAGGPVLEIQKHFAATGRPVSVLLTDKFPNRAAFRLAEAAGGGFITGRDEPVDAARVPESASGLRTMFNAFHHFRPAAARAILADAYGHRQPIAIFEVTERSLFNTVSNFILSFLTMLALLPTMRARRPEWWSFTYALPLLPAAFGWDGFASCMRSYTAAEFDRLKDGLEDESYTWRSGRLPVPGTLVHVNYFLGIPRGAAGVRAGKQRA